MTRFLWLASLILALFTSAVFADEKGKKPGPGDKSGTVRIEVRGKLVRQKGIYCVEARNEGGDTFLVHLVRTEDKNRPLDEHVEGLVGSVVEVRGVLRFIAGRSDGPPLGIHLRDQSQISKAE